MIGDTPYDAEAASGAGAAAAGVLSGGFTEDALRGAGCLAIAGEISRLLGALRIKTVSAEQLGTYDARGYWACSIPADTSPQRSTCIIT